MAKARRKNLGTPIFLRTAKIHEWANEGKAAAKSSRMMPEESRKNFAKWTAAASVYMMLSIRLRPLTKPRCLGETVRAAICARLAFNAEAMTFATAFDSESGRVDSGNRAMPWASLSYSPLGRKPCWRR